MMRSPRIIGPSLAAPEKPMPLGDTRRSRSTSSSWRRRADEEDVDVLVEAKTRATARD